jgi:hypothetical protein
MVRRFPQPWTVRESADAFWVEDAEGKQFAFCYFRHNRAGVTSPAILSKDEARRLTVNIAKLPSHLVREP